MITALADYDAFLAGLVPPLERDPFGDERPVLAWRPSTDEERLDLARWLVTRPYSNIGIPAADSDWVTPEILVVATVDHDHEPHLEVYQRADLIERVHRSVENLATTLDDDGQPFDDYGWVDAWEDADAKYQPLAHEQKSRSRFVGCGSFVAWRWQICSRSGP